MPKVYNGDLTKMFDISGKKAVIFGGAGGFLGEGFTDDGNQLVIIKGHHDLRRLAGSRFGGFGGRSFRQFLSPCRNRCQKRPEKAEQDSQQHTQAFIHHLKTPP